MSMHSVLAILSLLIQLNPPIRKIFPAAQQDPDSVRGTLTWKGLGLDPFILHNGIR